MGIPVERQVTIIAEPHMSRRTVRPGGIVTLRTSERPNSITLRRIRRAVPSHVVAHDNHLRGHIVTADVAYLAITTLTYYRPAMITKKIHDILRRAGAQLLVANVRSIPIVILAKSG
jgi:hypothetical protein